MNVERVDRVTDDGYLRTEWTIEREDGTVETRAEERRPEADGTVSRRYEGPDGTRREVIEDLTTGEVRKP